MGSPVVVPSAELLEVARAELRTHAYVRSDVELAAAGLTMDRTCEHDVTRAVLLRAVSAGLDDLLDAEALDGPELLERLMDAMTPEAPERARTFVDAVIAALKVEVPSD